MSEISGYDATLFTLAHFEALKVLALAVEDVTQMENRLKVIVKSALMDSPHESAMASLVRMRRQLTYKSEWSYAIVERAERVVKCAKEAVAIIDKALEANGGPA